MSNATSESTASKRAARVAGNKKYTGRPCKHCGSSVRYTCCSRCVICECRKAESWQQARRLWEKANA